MIEIQTQIQIQKYKYIHICRNMKIHPPQTAQWHSSQRKTSPITYLKYQSSSSSKSYLVNIIQIIIFINIQIIISIIISSLFSLLFSSTWLAATPRLSLTILRWKFWADLKWRKSAIFLTFGPINLNSGFSSLLVAQFRFGQSSNTSVNIRSNFKNLGIRTFVVVSGSFGFLLENINTSFKNCLGKSSKN